MAVEVEVFTAVEAAVTLFPEVSPRLDDIDRVNLEG